MDAVNLFQYFAALLILAGMLGALGLVAYAIQRGWILSNLTGLRMTDPRRRRLEISETLVLDPQRRVIILRQDEHEHVLLLGRSGETVLARQDAPPAPEPENAPEAPPAEGSTSLLARLKGQAR